MPQPSQPVVIPLEPSIPWYRITAALGETSYIFDVKWNARDAAWYFDLLEIDETPIAHGLKIVLGTLIGRRIKHPLFQQGVFAALDLTKQWRDAGFDDIGTRVQLRYYTAYAILAAARQVNGVGA